LPDPRYPAPCQVNTRVWLIELSRALGRRAMLDDIPDAELDRLAELGFDGAWFLSVWQTGPAARAISRANPERRREFAETLPELNGEDEPPWRTAHCLLDSSSTVGEVTPFPASWRVQLQFRFGRYNS